MSHVVPLTTAVPGSVSAPRGASRIAIAGSPLLAVGARGVVSVSHDRALMAAAFGPPGQEAKHDSPSRNGARPPSERSAVRFMRPSRGSSPHAATTTPAARCDVPADCEGPSLTTAVAVNRNPLGRGWPLESARVSPSTPPLASGVSRRLARMGWHLFRTVVSAGAVIFAPRGGSRVRAFDRTDPGGSPDRARSIDDESHTQKLGRATPATVLRLPELSLATRGAPPLAATEHVPVGHAFTMRWGRA